MKDSTLRALFRAMASERGRRVLGGYQNALLRREVVHAAAHSPFYRRKFAEHGVDPRAIRTASDLVRLGFYTHPEDLQADPYDFLAVPREEILYAMSSSGATGQPKIVFFSKNDWELAGRLVGNALTMMGVTPADVAQILFCYGNPFWPTGGVIESALERIGTCILPAGNSLSVAQQIEMMQQFGTTMLLGTPSYLHRLTEEGRKLCDLRSLGVRLIRLGAEPWSEALRQHLEEAWGAAVYDAYGMIELGAAGAGECAAVSGLHLSPYLLVEVVHPQTGEPLPRGELGELVFTTMAREATPLLRYRSGDLGRLLADEVCPCGELPTDRISRIVGRCDDMLFLGTGENTFPAQFDAAITGIEGVTGHQVIIDKSGYQDRLCIRVEVAAPRDDLEHTIRQRLYHEIHFLEYEIGQSQSIAPLEIECLEPGTLHRESPVKVRALVDRRPQAREPGNPAGGTDA